MKKVNLSIEREKARMSMHCKLFHLYKNDIRRSDMGGDLEGDCGILMMNNIRATRAKGRLSKHGQGEKHMLLANMLDASEHIQQECVRQLAVVHRTPFGVLGSLSGNEEWNRARELSGMDLASMQVIEWACATGAAACRPIIEPGFAPGISAVPAHRYIAFSSPTNPMVPLAYLEFLGSGDLFSSPVMFISVIEAANPRFETWRNVYAFTQYEKTGNPRDRQMSLAGTAYPWFYQGRPLLPVVFYQGENAPTELTPTIPKYLISTLDIMTELSDNRVHAYVGAHNKLIVSSKAGVSGLERSSVDSISYINITGDDVKTAIQPSAIEASKGLMEISKARINRYVGSINRSLQVMEEKGPQSGYAISLQMTDLWNWWKQQCTANRLKDIHLVRVLISSWNYAVRVGYWQGSPIQEVSDISIEFTPSWTPEQQERILDSIWKAIEVGAATEVDYYLAIHGKSDAHRADAEEAIIKLKQEKARIQQASDFYEVRLNRNELDMAKQNGVAGTIQFIELERHKAVGNALRALKDAGVDVDANTYAQNYGVPILVKPMPTYVEAVRTTSESDQQAAGAFNTLVEAGVKVDHIKYFADRGIPILSVDEMEVGQTWTAPRDVASEASAGSSLYSRYNRPGVPAESRRGSPAAYRMAGKLKRGDALNRGDLVDIVTFTDQAESAGTGQDGWQDDNDPSSQWIDFRCYGGEPGRTWANAELDKLDGVPGNNAESLQGDDIAREEGNEP